MIDSPEYRQLEVERERNRKKELDREEVQKEREFGCTILN